MQLRKIDLKLPRGRRMSRWRDRLHRPLPCGCPPRQAVPDGIFSAMARGSSRPARCCVAQQKCSRWMNLVICPLMTPGGVFMDHFGAVQSIGLTCPGTRLHFLDTKAENLAAECQPLRSRWTASFRPDAARRGSERSPRHEQTRHTRRRNHPPCKPAPTTVAASRGSLTHTQTPTWGITVGFKQLLASKEVWLLACGPSKAEIVQRILQGRITPDVPASLSVAHPQPLLRGRGSGSGIACRIGWSGFFLTPDRFDGRGRVDWRSRDALRLRQRGFDHHAPAGDTR